MKDHMSYKTTLCGSMDSFKSQVSLYLVFTTLLKFGWSFTCELPKKHEWYVTGNTNLSLYLHPSACGDSVM